MLDSVHIWYRSFLLHNSHNGLVVGSSPISNAPQRFSFYIKCDFHYSFISPEDLMKNLPKVMSNVFGASGGMSRYSPTFYISMKEHEDKAIKIGDKVEIKINKVDSSGI